jgi:hypothetical protein
MSQIAVTMPEAKYRSTKKGAQAVLTIRTSEFAAELQSLRPANEKAEIENKGEKKAAQKTGFNVAGFWPFVVGLFLAGFAPEWHTMAAQAGIWVMRLSFPLSLLNSHSGIGTSSQMAIYAQLAIDGLLAMLALARTKSRKSAIVQVFLVHAVCALVLLLLTLTGS